MTNRQRINYINKTLEKVELYYRLMGKVSFDMQCIAPKKGLQRASDDINRISSIPFKLMHSKKFMSTVDELYLNHEGLNEYEVKLISNLHESKEKSKNITPKMQEEYQKATSDSYLKWLECKEKGDYEGFKPYLGKVIELTKQRVLLRDKQEKTIYDTILNDFEKGNSIEVLDSYFSKLKEGIVPLVRKILNSKKVIRDDFLSRKVEIYKQERFSKWLLEHEGLDMDALVLMTTEHPFTTGFGLGDTRVTTHYYEDMFISNLYSIMHEGGHALFDQNEPEIFHKYHIEGHMSMAMHECASRFFENMVGRSKAFIDLIYPKFLELFNEEFKDVTKQELYEGVNIATPSLIRTEADELTYSLHILIRYELEKGFINGEFGVEDLDKRWNEKYKEYLGVDVPNNKEGILQDVHWTDTYGYFPSYSLGSAYAAQIYKTMEKDLNIEECIRNDEIYKIRDWLKEHAWSIASITDPNDWILKVTGEKFNPDYYINYLKEKFTEIYDLED